MTENRESLQQYRLRQARESLDAARVLLDNGIYRTCVSQSYYAMFYGVLALLLETGRSTSKHSGALRYFDLDFVREQKLPRKLSKWLHDAFERRLEADYREFIEVPAETARETLGHAEQFVAAVEAYIVD